MNVARVNFATFFFLFCSGVCALEVRVNDTRERNFHLDALKFILNKSDVPYELKIERNYPLSQSRKVQEVRNGNLDLIYMGTSQQLEQQLLPIRYPTMRGLIGQRVFIINKNQQKKFFKVRGLNDLKKMKGLQGLGWMDVQILHAAGLRQTMTMYDNIFKMINSDRPYYFSRGVIEAYTELELQREKHPNLIVEKNIVLEYPAAIFFFVSPTNKALAEALNRGFQRAYEDGSYEDFFYNHPLIKNALIQSKLENRIRISIPNPLISHETAKIAQRYWHQAGQGLN